MKLAICLACALTAGAAPILSTFEPWAQGVYPSGHNQDGFTVSSTAGGLISVLPYIWQPVDPNEQPPPNTPGAPDTWQNILAFNTLTDSPFSSFTIQFDTLVNLYGFRWADTNNLPSPRALVEAFYGNTLLDSRTLLALYNQEDYAGLVVDRLVFSDLGGDGHVIDNLEFAPVPEPATGVLIALGLGFVLLRTAPLRKPTKG